MLVARTTEIKLKLKIKQILFRVDEIVYFSPRTIREIKRSTVGGVHIQI